MVGEPSLRGFLEHCHLRVDQALDRCLPAADSSPQRLHRAMRYAVLNGGKRIRPLLTYATAAAVGRAADAVDGAACAVELIHCYSLVHDDLPVMDNDELRRGQPTCHRAFDEPTALLVGDALQALAFSTLAADRGLEATAETRLEMVRLLAQASGSRGMAGGQAIDLESVGQRLNVADLEYMHIRKTGALIRCSVLLGTLCAVDLPAETRRSLDHYAKCLGLAFQIRDDILDVEGSTERLGKRRGQDRALDKPTYVSLLGLGAAKEKAAELHRQAHDRLADLGTPADPLREIADFIVERDR